MLTHAQVPANDGGLALGQAAIAAARSHQGARPMKEATHVPRDSRQIVGIDDAERAVAMVDVGGVRRQINIGCIMDDGASGEACLGEWVLVHVGFAMSRHRCRAGGGTLTS